MLRRLETAQRPLRDECGVQGHPCGRARRIRDLERDDSISTNQAPTSGSCEATRESTNRRGTKDGQRVMPPPPDLRPTLVAAWRTNNRVTISFVQRLPSGLWDTAVPGAPRRTIRTIAAHLHNARCSWVKTLGREHGVIPPARVDHRRVSPRQLVAALKRSGDGIEALLRLGFASDGQVPPSRGYVWRNLSLDVGHVLTYFVAHEAHHRGQIVLVARQTGHRLPMPITDALWQWKTHAAAAGARKRLARSSRA